MRSSKITLCCLFLLIVSAAFIAPNDVVEALVEKLWTYNKENPAPILHLHLDKTIYNTNEDIWFKAYLLTPDADSSRVLYVRLTDVNKRIIVAEQFPITDIRANGDILIPDTLKDGNYYVYAYTSRMMNFNSRNIFAQRITVTHNSARKLIAEATVVDTNELKRGHNVKILLRVKDGNDLLKNIKVQYKLITDGQPAKVGKLTTNLFGEAVIDFIYPNLPDDQSLTVKIDFKNNDGIGDLSLNLKHEGNPVNVNLFADGGHFIAHVLTKTIVQATDIKANAIGAHITLKNKQQTVASLQLDKNGRGVLYFTPEVNADYTIEAESNGNKSIIPFCAAIENQGYQLKLRRQKNDCNVTLKNLGAESNATLVLRSFDEVLWSQPISVASGDSLTVGIPAGSYPKQVLNISLFNAAGKPLAERLFFNKATDTYNVAVKTDATTYGTRKKVTVSVHISDETGKPVMANLSVSAVEKARVSAADYRDILNTWYLKHMDGNDNQAPLSAMKGEDIDAMMITKSWQHNSWNDVVNYNAKGRLVTIKNPDGVVGYVKQLTKKPGKLKDFLVFGKRGVFPVAVTDSYFSISWADLVRDRSEKLYLMMSMDMVYQYEINLMDYPGIFDNKVTAGDALFIPETFNTLARFEEAKLAFNKGAIQLKEVKIKEKTGLTDEATGISIYRSVNCNDLVCMYNILNCRNHQGCCTVPVDGAVYSLNGRSVVYKTCVGNDVDAKTHIPLKCIGIPKQFYLPNYDRDPDPEPQLHSTIYWNPNLNTDQNGDVTFSFYTSDIKGDFLINAQGVAVRDILPLSGVGKFRVN